VVLDVGRGRRELLELLAERSGEPPDGRGAREALDGEVRKIGAHSYEIRRAVVERVLAGRQAPGSARVVPQARDGQVVGVRLSGIGRDSPFAAIGLADGDLLLAVNGRSIATPSAALEAYAALRAADHIWLAIERARQRIRIDYTIR
jgi:general secretion pathway protein C